MSTKGLRQVVPWWLRIGAKVVLSRLPVPYALWKSLRLFEHGDMNQPLRAFGTLVEHARTGGVIGDEPSRPCFTPAHRGSGFTVLELGPGDSLFTAIIARALGASQSWLVDAGPFATTDPQAYQACARYLQERGLGTPGFDASGSLDAMLRQCNSVYLTEGVHSLAQVPSASVDFCFSNAVLEHIPKEDMPLLVSEMLRVLKPDGVAVHRVDLKDHLGGSLNSLRFSDTVWEGPLFRRSGFYTNRIRFGDMVRMFEQAGFHCVVPRLLRWEQLPLPREKLAMRFRAVPDDDLRISGFDAVLRKGMVVR